MSENSVRTSVDLPRKLHSRLHQAAAAKGCSARQLILRGIERVVEETVHERPKRRLTLRAPIVRSTGKPIHLTDEQIYEGTEFP